MGGKIQKIVVNDLKNHTFYAIISIEIDGRAVEIDARPSDAIAIGVATSAPLYVADHVFEKVYKE